MNLSKEERIARHKSFLAANWRLIAAFGWEHYQKSGRGAVVADERDFIHHDIPQYAAITFRYIPDNSDRLKEAGGWPGDKEADWVRTYNPEEKVVLLIVREGGGTSGYLIGAKPTPPESFAAKQAETN